MPQTPNPTGKTAGPRPVPAAQVKAVEPAETLEPEHEHDCPPKEVQPYALENQKRFLKMKR